MKLGIVHQRITPSSPQENGAHERMHRTLKAKTTRPPAATHAGQQWKFDRFQNEYNFERPHEASPTRLLLLWVPSLDDSPVASAPEYPGHFELRRVSNAGSSSSDARHSSSATHSSSEYIGLEAVDDGVWNIIYYKTLLGRLNERTEQDHRRLFPIGRSVNDVPGHM